MENVQTMSDLMQQIQQRIYSIKASAMQQQTEMKQSLNECIEQSEAIQNQLVQSQQQLTSQLEYGTAVLIELEQGLQLDFSTEIAEFEQCTKKGTKTIDVTNKLFDEIAPKYADRNGGYTRIVKIGQRKGDGALEVLLELV